MANNVSNVRSPLLQELFEVPPAITQEHLEEFERHLKELKRLKTQYETLCQLPKIDFEVVESEIAEMLLHGCPVEPGPLRLVVAPGGKIAVSRERETEEPLPF